MQLKQLHSFSWDSHHTLACQRDLCELCVSSQGYYKVCTQGVKLNKTHHFILHQGHSSGQTGVHVVEHTVASTLTPLPVLWKELFCPSLPLYHQGRWPHRARGRQALVFLWRRIWLCRLPESISGPPGVHGHCLMQNWGPLHRCQSPENMAGTCHPLKSLAYYIKVKKQFLVVYVFAYKWKYTCMHTPFPPLPSWSLPGIKGQKFRKNWTFFLQETSLFSKLQKSKYCN